MKLSKKNQARQSAISKAIASGKALGGLLAGIATAAFTGCDGSRVPMGSFPNPNPEQQTNSASERHGRAGRMGKYLMEPEKPNKVNEKKEVFVTDGEIPARPGKPAAGEAKP